MTSHAPRLLWMAFTLLLWVMPLEGTANAARVYKTRTNINTSPAGAEVYITTADGQEMLGITPLKNVKIPRGVQKLTFKKDGYQDLDKTFEIGRYRKTYEVTLIRKIAPATMEFTSATDFHGAAITIDGTFAGNLPGSAKAPPGKHQAVIKLDGYETWERWIEVTEGQRVTFDVVLKPVAKAKGSILISSTPSGADVRVNGAPKGKTPTVIDGLDAGNYLVDLVLDKFQPYSQTVAVQPGERAVVNANLGGTVPEGGDLTILTDAVDATVFFDGRDMGPAPVTVPNAKPGKHLVEARTPSGRTAQQTAEVRAGETLTIRLELAEQAVSADMAIVRIVANVPGASVSIDGGPSGASPFVAKNLVPGTYFVTVTADGFAPWTQSVSLKAGTNPEVVAELGKSGKIHVKTKVDVQAEVFANGKLIGKTPLQGELPVGTHTILLKTGDGRQEEFDVAVGTDRIVKITAGFGEGATAAKKKKKGEVHRPMPWSARAMAPGTGNLDVWAGWPYLVGGSAGGGITEDMDVSVFLRSALDVINEIEGRFQWTFANTDTAAASVEGGLGGGFGLEDRNTFFGRVLVKGSLMISNSAALTARMGLLLYTDRTGPEDNPNHVERSGGATFTLGLSFEVAISDTFNFFIVYDGSPFGGDRKLLETSFFSEDINMVGSAGVSYLF